jgi:hypothetical protein
LTSADAGVDRETDSALYALMNRAEALAEYPRIWRRWQAALDAALAGHNVEFVAPDAERWRLRRLLGW